MNFFNIYIRIFTAWAFLNVIYNLKMLLRFNLKKTAPNTSYLKKIIFYLCNGCICLSHEVFLFLRICTFRRN